MGRCLGTSNAAALLLSDTRGSLAPIAATSFSWCRAEKDRQAYLIVPLDDGDETPTVACGIERPVAFLETQREERLRLAERCRRRKGADQGPRTGLPLTEKPLDSMTSAAAHG